MKNFLLRFFTWWNSYTFGTKLYTTRFGEKVGEDEFGNVYYRQKSKEISPDFRFERRWVLYNGTVEASRIPPGWWGWMHHRHDTPPTQEAYKPRPWQKPHRPNMTGTREAYRPAGSILRDAHRPAATGDYDAWTPG